MSGEAKRREYRSLADVYYARAEGEDVDPELVKRYERCDALCGAALRWPGAILTSALRSTMIDGSDYRLLWASAKLVYERIVAAEGATKKELVLADVLSQMAGTQPLRFVGSEGNAWIQHVAARSQVSLAFALEVLIPERVAAHHNESFKAKTTELNARVGSDDAVVVYNDYIASAHDITRVPDGGRINDSLGTTLDNPIGARGLIVPTGIDVLDRLMGGGPGRGDLVVIGGGTHAGKSLFAEQLMYAAPFQKKKLLYISVEDSEELMRCRSLSRHTAPPMPAMVIRGEGDGPLKHLYDQAVVDRAKDGLRVHEDGHVFVHVKRKGYCAEICQLMRRYRYQKGVDAVFVDYLQAVTPDERTNNDNHDTSRKVADLKRTAADIGVALYLGSQFNRDSYLDGKEPTLNSCKYAGDIENECEVMFLLWRDAEDKLHAKIPKIKWGKSSTGNRFFIKTHPVTGVFERWEQDFQQQSPPEPKKRPQQGGGRRTRSGFP